MLMARSKPEPKAEQDDYGGNSPGHAEHGQRGAAAVVLHGAVGFL